MRLSFQRESLQSLVWLIPGLLFISVFFILPIASVFWESVSGSEISLDNYRVIFGETLYRNVFWNTVVSAGGATIACLIIGYPLAYGIYRSEGATKQLMLGLVLFSYAVGIVPRTFSWLVILGDRGLVNRAWLAISDSSTPIPLLYNQTGVLIGMTHVMLPFVTLILFGSMVRVNPRLVPAARTLGASPIRAFFRVFVPLTRPGITAAGMLIFTYSLGFYLVPAVLGGAGESTVVMQIQNLTLRVGEWGLGSALSTVLVLAAIGGASIYVRVTGLSDVYARE